MASNNTLERWRTKNPAAWKQAKHEPCRQCKAPAESTCIQVTNGTRFYGFHIVRLEDAHQTNLRKAKEGK